MGVIDWFKRGTAEMMVARPDGTKSQIVWKHPDKTIPMKSQLTVDADEKAIFFRDGKVVRVMDAGRYTLDSSNLPFLSNLVDSFTGGDVFIASRRHPAGLNGGATVRVLVRFGNHDGSQAGTHFPGTSPAENALDYAIAAAIIRAQGGSFAIDPGEGHETVLLIDIPA